MSISGGIDIQYAEVKRTNAVANDSPGSPRAKTDGEFVLKGNDTSVGFNFGVIYTPSSKWQFGAHYRSGMSHDLTGSATTTGLTGSLSGQNGSVSAVAGLDLPAILNLGLVRYFGDTRLLASLMWFG